MNKVLGMLQILGLEQQLLFYVSEQTITCSKSATKALEIREDNPKENIWI